MDDNGAVTDQGTTDGRESNHDGTDAAEYALDLIDEALGYVYPAALGAVASLSVADHLAAGPRTPQEVAAAIGVDAGYLYRTLRLLATRGVFREDPDGRFHLTPRAQPLRSDVPLSVRAAVAGITSSSAWHPAEAFEAAIRTGTTAFEQVYGMSFFEFLAQHPENAEEFGQTMASWSDAVDGLVADAYDFPATGTAVDVGGGHGGLLLHVLRRRPALRGVLVDLPQAVAGHRLAQLGADDRWDVVPGDFFAKVPAGDLYLLKYILHDWRDEQCVEILRNCRESMVQGGRVVVVEQVIPTGNEPDTGKLLDVVMLLNVGGRERTEAQFASLFDAAGLRLNRVLPTRARLSLIEAVAR